MQVSLQGRAYKRSQLYKHMVLVVDASGTLSDTVCPWTTDFTLTEIQHCKYNKLND